MTERDQRIMKMFDSGLAPSEIDKRMELPNGTAHLVIVAAWAYDKDNARYERADSGWSA